MRRLDQEVFICIDCEMTGLDFNTDEIIEVAVSKFTFKEVLENFESLIDPLREIPEESTKIHHITQEMVQGKPTIDKVLREIIQLVGDHVVIGHGVKYDLEMLAKAADKYSIPHRLHQNKVIDTLRLARLYGESPINSLEKLRIHFNVDEEGAHRAMSDVIVNMHVFKHLCRKFRFLHEVMNELSKPILMKIMPLGKHKGRLIKDLPIDYLRWAANKDFDQDLLFSLRTEIKKRNKGNLFNQAGNPFKDLMLS